MESDTTLPPLQRQPSYPKGLKDVDMSSQRPSLTKVFKTGELHRWVNTFILSFVFENGYQVRMDRSDPFAKEMLPFVWCCSL